ncbi:hypothetical protein ASPZODRAFT_131333, partial [Penicilliopsis zonata CBS 506.65]
MPPWSSRSPSIPSPSNSNQPTSSITTIPPAAPLERTALRSSPRDVPPGRAAPSMSPSLFAASPLSRRGHSRSVSHPSPAPFSGPGRRAAAAGEGGTAAAAAAVGGGNNRLVLKNHFLDSDDDDDDEVTYISGPLASSPRKGQARAGGQPPVVDDFLTGKCMTCSSTVRWPRNLKVFRCTNCLTVNDLEPVVDAPQEIGCSNTPGHAHPGPGGGDRVRRKAVPVSISRTQAIIDECVSVYLQRLLDGLGSSAAASPFTINEKKAERHYGVTSDGHLSPSNSHFFDPSSAYPRQQPPPPPPPPPPPRAGDLRSRSLSATRLPSGRSDDGHTETDQNYLTPQPPPRRRSDVKPGDVEGARRKLDVENTPNEDRSPRDAARFGTDSEPRDSDRHPSKRLFQALEDYLIASFKGCECLNGSFSTARPLPRAASDGCPPKMNLEHESQEDSAPSHTIPVFEPDAKLLLLGDVAENSTWWMNEWAQSSDAHAHPRGEKAMPRGHRAVTSRSPRINWAELAHWYQLIINAGDSWVEKWSAMQPSPTLNNEKCVRWRSIDTTMIDREIQEARLHVQRTLLKATENLLKRPRQPLKKPEEMRFLIILLMNPLLYSSSPQLTLRPVPQGARRPSHPNNTTTTNNNNVVRPTPREKPFSPSRKELPPTPSATRDGGPKNHSGIIKRILGQLSNMPNDCHHYLVSWFSRLSVGQFEKLVDVVGGFVTYRLSRQHGRRRRQSSRNENTLIPSFSSATGNTPAELHAAINGRTPPKVGKDKKEKPVVYEEDWQIRAAARVMSLLFTANNASASRRPPDNPAESTHHHHPNNNNNNNNNKEAARYGHVVPISTFYNTLLDYSDLVADFEAWETKTSKFCFCQYPFLLSIWAKIHVLEHDARRQMEVKAREAFFKSILNRKAISQYLVLKVRRDCLVEDSLQNVSEVVGSGQEDIKKGLRIEFIGEEGVDAGGLRKEWFLLLVREVFDPHHGLFLYDEDSRYCYFNPFCFENSEQFFLVGVLLGLAIYNSTILDVALPPFAFKKLLAAAPPSNSGVQTSTARPAFKSSLDDLAEYRPALAKGLRGLLEFEGDVSETFCYDFVAQVDRYGERVKVPLCAGGEKRPVTNANRREFVDLYVHYLLDTAVTRQFEPFKRGFFTVCGGNALSLFRPEEIELLVRGSDEPLDVTSLRAVATYDNWGSNARPESQSVVQWFWAFFGEASPAAQRKILSFITGSDRIPAMGATSLVIKLACLGEDSPRYPTARTCFNTLGLYRYGSREKLERMLWGAVVNSEGFGL